MTHTCKVCNVTSDVAEFYAGVNTRCKECHKAAVRKNRQDKIEYYAQYDAERYQKDPRVRSRHKRYAKTEDGKASMKKSREKWQKASPEKRACHVILNNAVKNGRLQKPKSCQVCGASGRIEGHHHDYTKPLDVEWLCRFCHAQKHKKEK